MHPQKPSWPLSCLYSQPGAGLGFIHKEALRDFSQSHSEEEDRVTWAGEGRWEVGNNRMVSCEEERGCRAEGRCVVPLRDLKQAWSLLNPRYLSGLGTHS